MLTTVFIFFPIFMTIIGIGVSALLIFQDKEMRRMKAVIDEQKAQYQNNTTALEKFYQEKKKLEKDKDDEIAKMESLLQDERDVSILAARSSEMLKVQLKQQHEELVKLKSDIQNLSEQLQKANETRLVEVQNEKQKWTDTLQSKETTLQKLGSEASSMESVMDTLALISKEMHRRLDEHYAKMRLLDEKAEENLELMAQLEH